MIIQADARRIPLQDGCVQCCVTSPPYFGLRDYGTARWEGGDPDCQHTGSVARTAPAGTAKQASNAGAVSVLSGDCRCGARRVDAQIGLEPSPDAYVAQLVTVFREVRRVLADDGVCWLNLGDSYAGWGAQGRQGESGQMSDRSVVSARQIAVAVRKTSRTGSVAELGGLKPKDLIGIPWRVAFALQADGWYLRSDIIWAKPNPMPESVTDRPTKAHEYVFLLSKSEKYFYDAEAISESAIPQRRTGVIGYVCPKDLDDSYIQGGRRASVKSGLNGPTGETRNARSVWSITTKPYAGAHFATMPEKLAERCILAGSRPGDLVLDPFGGSGTTVRVARRFNRRGVMLDLNPAYLELAKQRNSNIQPSVLELPDEATA